ncbi:carbohydrate ABC transporter permease [Alloiococcus sp. CFN-8]|uniref:carbohydrate ABC transporter permease n=1 Tax=Alloiococcus sp. CFN-8 TaxID=3416081 RepID=UPI003CF75E09
MKRKVDSDKIFDFIIYSLAVVILLIILYPLIFVVSASLSDPNSVVSGKVWLTPINFTLRAYEETFKSASIMTGYKNTIIYTFVGTFINMVMTIMAAYPLSKPDLKGRNFLMILITFTMFFSGGMIPSFLNIKDLGLYDSMWAMVLPGAINVTNLIIVKNYFQNYIPKELIEAAEIDGYSNIGILFNVVLPLAKPILAVITIYYMVSHWNSYFSALIYLRDQSKYPLQIFLRQILLQNQVGDMGTGDSVSNIMLYETLKYAVIIVSSVPVLIIYPFFQKFFQKGIMMGSVKG